MYTTIRMRKTKKRVTAATKLQALVRGKLAILEEECDTCGLQAVLALRRSRRPATASGIPDDTLKQASGPVARDQQSRTVLFRQQAVLT